MRTGEFEFNLRELAGSMGDFGTLLPLAIGYIVVNGMNPAGFLVMMGLANISLGLVYKIPMPLQPKKAIAAMAIAQEWSPSLIYACGFGTGVVWLVLSLSGLITKIAKATPHCVIRGIQFALAILLAIKGIQMISEAWLLGIVSILIILILRKNRYAPATIVLLILGILIAGLQGNLSNTIRMGFFLPPITTFSFKEIWQTLILVGFAQIFLTLTNAVIATTALLREYWPNRAISENKLGLNMGLMNVAVPFFGGMPMCHGAGGLAGQYYFGARTGGANVIEGLIEICLGVFFAKSVVGLFAVFPMSIIGAMLFSVGIELARFIKDMRGKIDILVLAATAVSSVIVNMAIGFALGLVLYYSFRKLGLSRG